MVISNVKEMNKRHKKANFTSMLVQ